MNLATMFGPTLRLPPRGALRTALAAALLLTLSGCLGFGTTIAMTGAELVSYANTKRSLLDHAASVISGEDCSMVKISEGKSYCVRESGQVGPPPRYCYRTLGEITCYAVPDPYGDGAWPVE